MDEILKYFPRLSDLQKQQLQLYMDRLVWWNARINLISRQDTGHIAQRHILHSLAIARAFQFPKGMRILDLGTGGGLPGIPLAICFPECRFTLIDGTGKKIKAVEAMIHDLGLQNVHAIHVRAEDFKGEYDFVVTRAVTGLKELWSWAKPLLGISREEARLTPRATPVHAGKTTLMSTSVEVRDTLFGEEGAEWQRGLIVLKGGDLSQEISELQKIGKTEKTIQILSIQDYFPEPYFSGKFIVFIPVIRESASLRSPGPGFVEGPV